MKKIILSFTLLHFFNLVGCTATMKVNPGEYVNYEQTEGKPNEIYIFTKDSLTYHFAAWMYDIKNDTMYAEGPQIVDGAEILFKGYIPLQDVTTIEWTEQTNNGLYYLMSGPLIVIATLAAIFAFSYAN